MIKRNWFVCLFTKYKYFMACNSKRKFLIGNFCWDKKGNDIYGEKVYYFEELFPEHQCQNCTRTKYYKENK